MKLRYRKLATLLSVALIGNLCLCSDVITAQAQENPKQTAIEQQETIENQEEDQDGIEEMLPEGTEMEADIDDLGDAEGMEPAKGEYPDTSSAASENLEKAGGQEISITTAGRTITRQGNITESGSAKWSLDTAGLLMMEGTIGQDEYYEDDFLCEYDDESMERTADYRGEVKTVVHRLSGDRYGSFFWGFNAYENLEHIDFSGADFSQIGDSGLSFAGCEKLKDVTFGSSKIKGLTNMSGMFQGCSSLVSVDLSSFDTSAVTSMRSMFSGCTALTSVDLSSFSTANVTDMSFMFSDCTALASVDLSSFNTANVTDMWGMFFGCGALTSVNLSSFNTGNVTDMSFMFSDCTALTSVDLSSFTTASVTDMRSMFSGCSKLEDLDLRSFSFASHNAELYPSLLVDDCEGLKKLMLPANVPFEMSLPFNYYWIDNQDIVCHETKANADAAMTYTRVGLIEGYDILTGGRSGSVIWVIDRLGTLSLFGDGNYALDGIWNGQSVPKWCEHNNDIEAVVVKAERLTTAQNMLAGCTKLKSITLPAGIQVSVGFPVITGWYWVDGSNVRYTAGKINTTAQETYTLLQEASQPTTPVTPTVPEAGTPEVKPLTKGSSFTDAKTKLKYKVTDASVSKPAVSCTGTANGKATKISIPATVEYQGIKYTVTEIGAKAFKGNKKITTITIGTAVTAVGNSALDGCTSLKSVTVGKSVKTIGSTVFKNCKSLKKITVKSTKLTKVGKNALKGVHKSCVIKAPKAQLKKYKSLFKG